MSEGNPGSGLEIAVVGMAGRFPGASDVREFWENLKRGVESISFFTDEELDEAGVDPGLYKNPKYVRAAGVLEGADSFDADFFDVSPREAEITDPQQRLFLECAWETLEDAGYDPRRFHGSIGLFGGMAANTYFRNLLAYPDLIAAVGEQQVIIANDKDFLCTRASYKLGLDGPSVVVQSACSTSLVAVHLASQALLAGECDLALAGGVAVVFPQKQGYMYMEGGIVSPDGHCRAFDARAQGTLLGQGLGLVALRRLSDAIEDGDTVRAVIKGSAITNDGALKTTYTAPGLEGQSRVVSAAQLMAEIEPETVSYVETHGTATELGDTIEIAALNRVFRAQTDKTQFCAIGSVKTNFGHLDTAAGAAGLIKTVLALENKALPPSLHFESPNPEIDFEASPFYVNASLADWPPGRTPRRAGVSSFGIGGTNAHLVLEEAPEPARGAGPARPWELVVLSARTPTALEAMTDNLAAHLERRTEHDLSDVAYTCQVGRRAFEHRRALVCRDRADAVEALRNRDAGRLLTVSPGRTAPKIAFLFPGLGDQYVGMGRGLYESEAGFRETVDQAAEILKPHLDLDVREVLYPAGEAGRGRPAPAGVDLRKMLRRDEADDEAGPFQRTALVQPVFFALEYATARLWTSWGVRPVAMVGYSLGEYAAACLSGVLPFEQALGLVARRAKLIDGLPAGAMLAIALPEDEVAAELGEDLSLSAVNGPAMCVVGGPPESVAALEERLARRDVVCRRLRTSHAFHSAMMEPIVRPFRELVGSVELREPQIPYLSNVTGTWIEPAQAMDPEYWVRHLTDPVRFGDSAGELWQDPDRALVEVGPGLSLSSLALQHPASGKAGERLVVASLRHDYEKEDDSAVVLKSISRLWLAGTEVDWDAFHAGEARRRVPLPTYPFERKRYYVEPGDLPLSVSNSGPLARKEDLAEWFYVPVWRQTPLPVAREEDDGRPAWLLFEDRSGLASELGDRLAGLGHRVVTVEEGEAFAATAEDRYTLRPAAPEDYKSLLRAVTSEEGTLPRMVHAWAVAGDGAERASAASILEHLDEAQDAGFFSLLFLAQALAEKGVTQAAELTVFTDGLRTVVGGETLQPEKSTLLGVVRCLPMEFPKTRVRCVDLAAGNEPPVELLLRELLSPPEDLLVAWRGRRRWVEGFEATRAESGDAVSKRLREGGVYLFTGGLGGVSLEIARHLAQQTHGKIVLLSRSGLLSREEWDSVAPETSAGRKIDKVRSVEAEGAEVFVLAADVTRPEDTERALAAVRERFGAIHGVVHAAGVAGEGLIAFKDRTDAAKVMAAKVRGTLVLENALAGEPLDFFALCSSLTSIQGGVGQVDYTAANAFLDAFGEWREATTGGDTVRVINWCTWREVGMAVETEIAPEFEAMREEGLRDGMDSREGIEVFRRALANPAPQLVISTLDLHANMERTLRETAQIADLMPRPTAMDRTHLAEPYVEPRGETEERIAHVWQEILGIEPVGVHDNFFQLGGHSLLGLQVISRLHEVFQVDLSPRLLFEAPTVAQLALALDGEAGAGATDSIPELIPVTSSADAAILDKLGGYSEEELDVLSDEEMDTLLAGMMEEEETKA